MQNVFRTATLPLCVALGASCNVDPAGAAASCPALASGPTGERGLAVVTSDDMMSSNVMLADWSGRVTTSSIFSSKTSEAGITTPLSGDVVLPTEAPAGGAVVVLDRYNSVVTWVDPATCVKTQLSVGDESNTDPYDYLEVPAAKKAYVARYSRDPNKPAGDIDRGDDVLVLDVSETTAPRKVKTLTFEDVLPKASFEVLARPAALLSFDPWAIVALQGLSTDYLHAVDATFAVVDTRADRVASHVTAAGVQNCQALTKLDASHFAAACDGVIPANHVIDAATTADSALVVFAIDASGGALHVDAVVRASSIGVSSFAFGTLAAIDASHVIVVEPDAPAGPAAGSDVYWLIDLGASPPSKTQLAAATAWNSGSARCQAIDGVTRCLVTVAHVSGVDGPPNALLSFSWNAARGSLTRSSTTENPDPTGLSPRFLGPY